VDPAESFTGALLGQVDGFDAAFDRNAEGCRSAGPERCGVEDLAAAYDEMARRVEERPLRTGGGPVGPSELAVAAIYVGYLDDGWRQLGPALADGLDGRGASLRNLADGYLAFGAFTAYVGVVCVDDAPPVDPDAYRAFADEARARSPRFGAPIANELLPCATWAAEPSEPLEEVTAPGAPPILVVGSTGDPATPFRNAVAVADRLESGVLLTVDADGHTAFGSNACATGVTERYLVDLEVPADGTRC
jgi:pimeloyl-ACP methyl ester carboxylesterase